MNQSALYFIGLETLPPVLHLDLLLKNSEVKYWNLNSFALDFIIRELYAPC